MSTKKAVASANLFLTGWQLVAFEYLLVATIDNEDNPQIRSMLKGPLLTFTSLAEQAKERPHSNFDVEITAPLWSLFRKHFARLRFDESVPPQGSLMKNLRDILEFEIERQLAMPETSATEPLTVPKGDEEQQTTPPPDTTPQGHGGSSFDDGSHMATEQDASVEAGRILSS